MLMQVYELIKYNKYKYLNDSIHKEKQHQIFNFEYTSQNII